MRVKLFLRSDHFWEPTFCGFIFWGRVNFFLEGGINDLGIQKIFGRGKGVLEVSTFSGGQLIWGVKFFGVKIFGGQIFQAVKFWASKFVGITILWGSQLLREKTFS